jgi:hypothetical protein
MDYFSFMNMGGGRVVMTSTTTTTYNTVGGRATILFLYAFYNLIALYLNA